LGQIVFNVQDETEGKDGFVVQRMRLGARLVGSERVEYVGVGEFAGDTPKVYDAYARFRWPRVEVVAGYAKTLPFISGRNEADDSFAVPERTLPVQAFWPSRDLGVEVQWRLAGTPLEASAWLGNGSGDTRGNDNSSLAAATRVDVVTGRALRGHASDHVGLRSGVTAYYADMASRKGVTGKTVTGFAFWEPPTVAGDRWLVEGHAVVFRGPLSLQAEGGWMREDRPPTAAGAPLDPVESHGAGVQAAWTWFGTPRRVGEPPAAEAGRETCGALETALRWSRLSLGRGATDLADGGATAMAAAVDWWAASYLSFHAAGYWYHYDEAPAAHPDDDDSLVGLVRTTVRWK
jgi:phosphate-selective porin